MGAYASVGSIEQRDIRISSTERTIMIIGVPKEVKPDEYRIAMIPAGAEALRRGGHEVIIQKGGGLGSGITDEEYAAAGAKIEPDAGAIWARAPI